MKYQFFVFIFCVVILKVNAQKDTSKTYMVLPLMYYTPETRIAYELFAFYTYYNKEVNKKSNIRLFATYTQNNQYLFLLPWQIYTSKEKYFLNGMLDYKSFPEYFYGIGNDTKESNRVLYSYNALTFDSKSYKKITANAYLGLAIRAQSLRTDLFSPNALFDAIDKKNGKNGYDQLLIGTSFMVDKRNHILCPTEGAYFEITSYYGAGATVENNRLSYSIIQFDYRNYMKLNSNNTLAHQFVAQFSVGEPPFRSLPTLGGANLHRGYYMGRFRDNHLMAYQSELRKHIKGRFGAVLFASLGRVYDTIDNSLFSNLRPAVGSGLRIRISKNDDANIRFDFSVTPDSNGFYIYFAEAF